MTLPALFGDSRSRSIATRLFISATVLSVVILFIAGLVLTALYRTTAESAFDERLGVYLRALVADLANAAPGDEGRLEIGQLADPNFELALSGWYWQITRIDGTAPEIRSSRSLFAARLPKLADSGVPGGVGGSRRGYVIGPDDQALRMVERVIDTGDQGVYLVQVAATTSEIEAQIHRFGFDLTITFAILAAVLVASSGLQLRYGLRPLWLLQAGVAAIRRGENEKIDGVFPRDIAPLAGELNLMIEANRDVVERARTQVGNLAHALKTPLSVIINEAARDESPFSRKVSEQATIMRDQVSYYLERARAAVSASKIGSATEIAPVVSALLRAFEKIYGDRGLIFESSGGAGLKFLGEKQDLEEMIGNLVDNAGKWARTAVEIQIAPEPVSGEGRAYFTVTIDDDGPGLDPSQHAAAIKRGQRLDESKPGSGLGLSIVDDLARIYGGTIALETSPKSGLRAKLRLPAA